MLTYSSDAIKYILFVFNLIFVITGVILIGVGVVIRTSFKEYETFLDDKFLSAPALLIFVGTVIFLIAFFGCCGAIQENHCMVMTFSILMGVIFVLELAAGIFGFVLRDEASKVLPVKLNESMDLYKNSTYIAEIWDQLQKNLECCGTKGYADWYPILNGSLPSSCCKSEGDSSSSCTAKSSTLFRSSCLDEVTEIVKEKAVVLGGVGISIAVIQLLGVVFACNLGRSIRSQYETV